ncbi:hypothetical protein DD592_26910 [Enterobacter cloacae complex sp. 2DZ2F20B]|nr:hypothetical protein DD592_26910 [Enterobacter cloacae complex sp. 2DZ2F20B]
MIYVNMIEKVQRKFLKFSHYKKFGFYPPRGFPEEELLQTFSINSLLKRRLYFSFIFLYKIVSGNIDCQDLLKCINLLVPRVNARRYDTFYIFTARTNVRKFSPIYTICENYNRNQDIFDIFNTTSRKIKNICLLQAE